MLLLQLSASTGPDECCLAVAKALQVLLTECAQAHVVPSVLEQMPGDRAGTWRSVLLVLDGANAAALAQRWRGSVQWCCPSPYRPTHRRKNWFMGVEVFQVSPAQATDDLKDQDLRFDTLRASGPGGQHVNKTDSAVRLTHLPTGLSVKVQTERSQHANKRLARALLQHKLHQLASEVADGARAARRLQHYTVQRGSPVRVFSGPDFQEGR